MHILVFEFNRQERTDCSKKKLSSRGVLLKRCCKKFRKMHRKTPVLESLF